MRWLVVALSFIFFTSSVHAAIADVPSPPAYSDADVQDLVRAVLAIPTDHRFLLGLEPARSAQLPAWDPIAHYAGPTTIPDGRTACVVLVNDKYASVLTDLGHADHAVGAAVASAVFLAVIDAGRAGSKWKAWYDSAAAADATLPSSVDDRFANRRALVGALADQKTALYASIAGPDSPAMDQFNLPLTEPIHYGTGLLRDARLGIGAARLIELFEYSGALSRQSTKTFIDSWFTQFGTQLPGDTLRTELKGLRPLFVVDDSANLQSNQQYFGGEMLALVKKFDDGKLEAFGLGYDANELRYNAQAIKNANEDTVLRTLVARSGRLDGAIPGLKELRKRLGSLDKGDWSTIADVAGQIIKKLT